MRIADALTGINRLFLDTAPVIYHVEGNPAYQATTDLIFQRIQAGEIRAVTSSVTLAECLVHPLRRGDEALAEQFRRVITAGRHTNYVGIDAAAERAAELRARHNLTLTDAFQVAAALMAGCDGFLTNDAGIRRAHELRVLVLDDLEPD